MLAGAVEVEHRAIRPDRTASPCAAAASASATASWPVPPVTRIGAVMSGRVCHSPHSASRGRARSLSDRIASPGAIGQGMASAGSFQITPRSACRSHGAVTL